MAKLEKDFSTDFRRTLLESKSSACLIVNMEYDVISFWVSSAAADRRSPAASAAPAWMTLPEWCLCVCNNNNSNYCGNGSSNRIDLYIKRAVYNNDIHSNNKTYYSNRASV